MGTASPSARGVIARGYEFWGIPPLWHGETAFVLGGGPTLTQTMADAVADRHAIAINSTCLIAPRAEILFFNDHSWFERHQEIVTNWAGLAVTTNRHSKVAAPDRLLRVEGEDRKDFPALGSKTIRRGASSGHLAVSLAIALGAVRIVLLGFDMRHVHGRSHHHDDYRNEIHDLYSRLFAPAFQGWHYAAQQRGVSIVNATPGSALKEFPMVALDDMLSPVAVA
jgi:hypothetical protein